MEHILTEYYQIANSFFANVWLDYHLPCLKTPNNDQSTESSSPSLGWVATSGPGCCCSSSSWCPPSPGLYVVDCRTRWSLWYSYLDFYIDHLFFDTQMTEKYSICATRSRTDIDCILDNEQCQFSAELSRNPRTQRMEWKQNVIRTVMEAGVSIPSL